jgi:hypothetical protein
MNLNKLTKAELMLKLKKLQDKTNNSGLLSKLLVFKSLILKITLIAVLIKTFRKYSFLRRMWTVLNMIIVSIFGISLFDIYGLSFFSAILDTIRSTYVYTWFLGLLDTKQVEEIPSRLKQINSSTATNEKNSGIVEGFKKLIIKEEPQIEDDSPLYKNKWAIIAVILLLSGLGWWYFGDNIKSYFFKPSDDDIRKGIRSRLRYNEQTNKIEEVPILPDVPTNEPSIERTWLNSIKDFFDISKWRKNTQGDNTQAEIFDAGNVTDIELEDRLNKLKSDQGINNSGPIDLDKLKPNNLDLNKNPIENKLDEIYNEWDKPKSPSECSINHYFPEVDQVNTELTNNEILKHLTGEADQRFDLESNEIIGQVNTFLDYHDNNMFPSDTIKSTMYKAISAKLLSMTILNSIRYNDWLKRTDVAPNLVRFNILENSINSIDEQSDTYAEIANATVIEQEAWSDDGTRASTPKINDVPDIEIEDIKNTPKIDNKPLDTVPTLRDRIEETKTKFTGLFDSILNKQKESNLETTLEQPVASSSKVKVEDLSNNPEVDQPNSDGSDNSFGRYFPDHNNLNEVKSQWKESPLLGDKHLDLPKIIVSEQTPEDTTIQDRVEEILESPKAKFNALFSSINALRDGATKVLKSVSTDKTVDTGGVIENIKTDNPQEFEGKSIPIIKPSKIESPIPQNPSVSNLFDDTMALFDDEPDNTLIEDTQQETNIPDDSTSSEVIDSWDKIKIDIWDKSKQINIQFGGLWNEVDSVHFATSDNHLSVQDINNLGNTGVQTKVNDTFVWDRRATSDFNSELKEVIIKDLNGKTHSIYRNDKFFK